MRLTDKSRAKDRARPTRARAEHRDRAELRESTRSEPRERETEHQSRQRRESSQRPARDQVSEIAAQAEPREQPKKQAPEQSW